MFQLRNLRIPVWVLCCAALGVGAPQVTAQHDSTQVTAQHDSPVKKRGKAAIEYRDKDIQVVAAYYYSQRNHDIPWLYFESGLTTRDESVIHRKEITLRTPQGQDIPLASQKRVGDDTDHIQQLLNNAKPVSHDIRSYFTQQNRFEDMQLFRLPFGRIIHDEFIVDREHVAVGPLFFESEAGTWPSGTYTLVVRHKTGTAELPVELK